MAKINERPNVTTVTDNIKMPTGEVGDLTITPLQIKNYTFNNVQNGQNITVSVDAGVLTIGQVDIVDKDQLFVVDDSTLFDSGVYAISSQYIAEYTLGKLSGSGNIDVTQDINGFVISENDIADRTVDSISDTTRFNVGQNVVFASDVKEYVKTTDLTQFQLLPSILASGEVQYFTVSCNNQIRLFNIITTQPNTLVRVYLSEAEMIADNVRPVTEFHSESSGLLFEFLSADVLLSKKLSPEVDIYTPNEQLFIAVKNNGATAFATQVLLQYLINGV